MKVLENETARRQELGADGPGREYTQESTPAACSSASQAGQWHSSNAPSLEEYIETPLPEGERNDSLFRAVMQARERQWSEMDIHRVVGGKAVKDGLPESEVRKTIDSAMSRPLDPEAVAKWQNPPGHQKSKSGGWALDEHGVIGGTRQAPPALKAPPAAPGPAGPFPERAPDWEHTDLPRFLGALFRSDECVSYVVDWDENDDGKRHPVGKGIYKRTAQQILEWQGAEKTATETVFPKECGAWVRLNPFDGEGIKDANVTEYRHALVESDSMPIADQWRIIQELRVPCATVVHSGGKSLHFAVKVYAGTDKDEFKRRVDKLYEVLESHGMKVDRANRNPSRLSRMPGVWREDQEQWLVATNIGCKDWGEWLSYLEARGGGRPVRNTPDESHAHDSTGAAPPRAATPSGARPAAIANHVREKDATGKTLKKAIPIGTISATLREITGDWPRRVGNLLFVNEPGTSEIRWLEDANGLFAWLHEQAPVNWYANPDTRGRSCVSKAEFLSHLAATVRAYEGVETLPHEPRIKGHYYAWQRPAGYVSIGKHLDELLTFFDNAATEQDAALIRAMFLTPAWGGLPGARPAFVVAAPDRGCGKSTLTDALAALYGGAIEIEPNGDESRIVQRLLSPAALLQRVARLDNVKGAKSSALIEGLVTTREISGHRLYHGEARRPNHLTWTLTANSPRLSRDLADRSFIIRLAKPKPRPGWRETVFEYIDAHRGRILADVIEALRLTQASGPAFDRWQSWVDGVLRRCTIDAAGIVAQNQQRRNAHDDDIDEAQAIADAVAQAEGIQREMDGSAFVTSTQMLEIVNNALGLKLSARSLKSRIEAHIEAGRLPGFEHARTMTARGYRLRANAQ